MEKTMATINKASNIGGNAGARRVLEDEYGAKLRSQAENDKTEKLTKEASVKLEKLEERIERYNIGFVEAGEALRIIRRERLHKATHGDFADYYRERWGFTPQRAHQLINGAKVAKAILTAVESDGLTGVENEAQARELSRIEKDDDRVLVWREAVERAGDKRVTAQLLSEIIAERGLAKQQKANPSATPARVIQQIANFTNSVQEKVKAVALRKWTPKQRTNLRTSLLAVRKEIDRIESSLKKLDEKKGTKASSRRAA